jgi:hypothetical protein
VSVIEGVITVLGAVLLGTILYAVLAVWPAMLLFGAVHSFLPIIPAFGFWQTAAVVLLLRILFGGGWSGKSES